MEQQFVDAHISSSMVIIPVNLENQHWTLMVRDNKLKRDIWIDPLKTPYSTKLSLEKGRKINNKLNEALCQKHDFQTQRLTRVRFQENTYDCGPMICFYARQLIQDEPLTDREISLLEMRKLIHITLQNEEKLTGGGRRTTTLSEDKAEALNRSIDFHYKDNKKIHIIDAKIISSMLILNKKTLAKKIQLINFNDIKYAACLFHHENDTILYIYKYQEQVSHIINTTSNNYSDQLSQIGERLTTLVNAFTLDGQCKLELKKIPDTIGEKDEFLKIASLCNKEFNTDDKPDLEMAEAIAGIKPKQMVEEKREMARRINIRINEIDIENYFKEINHDEEHILLNIILTTAIIEENWDHIISWSNLDKLKKAKVMYCLLPPYGKHTTLAIIDFNSWEYYTFDPRNDNPEESLLKLTHHLAEKIEHFCLINGGILTHNKCPYIAQRSGLYNYILICRYIKGFMYNEDLKNDTIGEIGEQLANFVDLKTGTWNKEKYEEYEMEDTAVTKRRRITKSILLVEKHLNDDAESIYEAIANNIPITRPPGKTERRPYLGKKKLFEIPDKVILQANFRKCMGKTVNKIITCAENVTEQPTVNDIEEAYNQIEEATYNPELLRVWEPMYDTLEITEITNDEVIQILKKKKNSTPGPDGIQYKDLLLLDPEGRILSLLFNKIVKTGISPSSWKNFQTVLIPKPGKTNYTEINNWRPIALANTSYKVFTSILCERIQSWVNEHKLISKGQKGGSKYEGCIEHNAILNAIMEDVRQKHRNYQSKKPVFIAWLDIKAAFPSVPHSYMLECLRKIGLGESYIRIVKNLYQDTTSTYRCAHTVTRNLQIKVGLKQGCPLSMLPITKYDLFGMKVQCLMYADDMAIVAYSKEDLQELLKIASDKGRQCNLIFQPAKCAYMGIPHDSSPSEIKIDGQIIQKLNPGEFYQYLGVPLGNKNDQNPTELINQILSDSKAISISGLQQHQKLQAIKAIIFPRITFVFRTREIARNFLQVPYTESTKSRGNPSNKLRMIIREILSLPQHAETAYLYADTASGGVGLWDLFDEYNLQQIVQAFKLLNCKDPEVAMVMKESLYVAAHIRMGYAPANQFEALLWINGQTPPHNNSNAAKTWWTRIKTEFQRFASKLKKYFALEYANGYYNLRITDAAGITTVATNKNINNISEVLHNVIHKAYQVKWLRSKISNLLCEQLATKAWTNKLIYNGLIGPLGWSCIHRARTNSLSVHAHPRNTTIESRRCRRCKEPNETIVHVLQNCKPNMCLVDDRHKACLNLIYNAVLNENLIVLRDRVLPFLNDDAEVGRMRIDLYIDDVYKKEIILADLKCPIDMPACFQNADTNNINKYQPLKSKVQKAKPGCKVTLLTIIVGSLGCIPEQSTKILKKLVINNSRVKKLQEDLSITCIRHSARIWQMHCTGELIDPTQGFERSTFYKLECPLAILNEQPTDLDEDEVQNNE